MSKKLEIVIDFDGTCVTHEYPLVGSDIGAVPVLKLLVDEGHRLILSTMRSNKPFTKVDGSIDTSGLDDAVSWFRTNGIPLYGIQTNPTQKTWTDSPKAYGQLHIDDAALGCPLIYPKGNARPYVDWIEVRRLLEKRGLIPKVPTYNLFLDDERMPEDVYNFMMKDAYGDAFMEMEASMYQKNDNWVIVRTYHEFILQIATYGFPFMVSFDHDLADFSGPNREERTGMDCAKWMVSVLMNKPEEFPIWKVHSKNTVGAENIDKYLKNARKHIK